MTMAPLWGLSSGGSVRRCCDSPVRRFCAPVLCLPWTVLCCVQVRLQAHNRQVAITLSDSFCVDRYRDEFLHLMRSKTVDLVFANEEEVKSLYQTSDFETAISALKQDTALATVTRGEKGAIVINKEERFEVKAETIGQLVDTTGAGDLYAAGFLYGLTHQYHLSDCARIGCLAASEVIQHIGPRPQCSLKDLLAQNPIGA